MSSQDGCTYPLIELILSVAGLICCIAMMIIYFKSDNFKLFSYTIQLYILLGASLYTLLDFTFNVFQFSICHTFELKYILEKSICQITSYISVYGVMNVVSWQTVLIKIAKEAILYKKQEQLSVHVKLCNIQLNLIAFAFFFPIICTILPQLSSSKKQSKGESTDQNYDDFIYGLFDNVCWLQYNFTITQSNPCNSNSVSEPESNLQNLQTSLSRTIVTLSLLCFFLPIIFQSIIQLTDLRSISKKIEAMKINKEIFKGHENHINAIKGLYLVPYFILLTCVVPAFLFFLEYFHRPAQDSTLVIFQICKALLSCLGLLIFVMFLQNAHIKLVVSQMFKMKEKSIYDFQIDLFSGLEEFDLKKSDVNKQE
ncbi:unnamed protein product (macronuclear) [Paramecium tetraurelia]|uniref:G-protein coupled receptors family 1 profile domain-containing protein n=1 Tax=Paramecium tetraurelia TaxID=5888 RepID=A0C0N2_PARTE|nr:uncharacterized protein GSPATT00006202001 [Paramecium tetraurelia]CAK64349.1 unnamed protein product [Paramecium tetraurelia]|eukprot:XP_001431747.1 hypothetical protein (macronuclear) [Paramecium tetraurelia strain d4-2]